MQTYDSSRDFKHFMDTIIYYQEKRMVRMSYWNPNKHVETTPQILLVKVIAYCLMPNHFHLLLQQIEENGIQTFMGYIQNSYTKYFNIKNKRTGPLFQGRFKAKHIEDTNTLLHVSRYIHLNPIVGSITKDLTTYPWSSYSDFTSTQRKFISPEIILEQFKSKEAYKKFTLNHVDYAKKIESIKHLVLE